MQIYMLEKSDKVKTDGLPSSCLRCWHHASLSSYVRWTSYIYIM